MNRQLTTLFAALEALLVIGVGVGISLVPLTLMWAVQYELQLDWTVFWRASVDIWLLGHGADVRFVLDPQVAAASGIAGAHDAFWVTIAPLGFAIVTALLGIRAGRRIGDIEHRDLGLAVAAVVFAGIASILTVAVTMPSASPSLAQGALLPTLVFVVGLAIGTARASRALRSIGRPAPDSRIADAFDRLRGSIDERMPGIRLLVRAAIAGGIAAVGLLIAAASLAVALLLGFSFAEIIALFEAVQSGALGGAALTVGQLAFVPNLVIWAASWFVGPGFAIGAGSSVSPLGTALGPLPAVPVLAALPVGELAFGFVGILVPVLAGFASGLAILPRLQRAGYDDRRTLIGTGVGTGLVAGILFGVLAWMASGSAGPGRLVEVGASWLPVGGFAALEVAIGATIALLLDEMRRGRRADTADDARDLPDSRVEIAVSADDARDLPADPSRFADTADDAGGLPAGSIVDRGAGDSSR